MKLSIIQPAIQKKFYEASKKLGVLPKKNDNCHTHFFTAENLNNAFVSNNNADVDSSLIDEQIRQLYIKNPPCLHTFNFEPVSELDVSKTLKAIKTNSTGADYLNAFTLNFFIDRISDVLTNIINTSFETAIFLDRWKLAIIKPIPKIEFPLKETDFRPISLLCTLSKIIGRPENKQIYLVK